MWPEKFQNKTNGITPRRWLLLCNPSLSDEIIGALGDDSWITHFERLKELRHLSNNTEFLQNLMVIKRENKAKFASYMEQRYKIKIDPSTLFDFQVSWFPTLTTHNNIYISVVSHSFALFAHR